MTERQTIHLDLDHVLETLRRGVRRSDVFMGIGLNAAENNPPVSHILAPDNVHTIHLVKENLTDQEKEHVAREFGKWVRANGLRELLETFSIFMFELYQVVFYLLRYRDKLGALEHYPPPKFELMGIGAQIEKLTEAITVPKNDVRVIRSLNQARNCYAHRRGLVGEADIDKDTDIFSLVWTAFQMEILEPDGNVVSEPDMFGRTFEKGGIMQMRVVERKKDTQRGEELMVEKRELKEICLCVLSVGQRLFNETVGHARREGILAEKVSDNLDDPKPV